MMMPLRLFFLPAFAADFSILPPPVVIVALLRAAVTLFFDTAMPDADVAGYCYAMPLP